MASKYRNIIASFYGAPWAITQDKMDEIAELLELRASGQTLSQEQIAARLGDVQQRESPDSPSIGVLQIFGTLSQRANMLTQFSGGTSYDQLAAQFDAALADDNVQQIVLHVDSPGGSVFGALELSNQIFDGRGTKPITAVVDGQGASAAYLIASAADEIVITPTGMAGSIGVLMMHRDSSKFQEESGLRNVVIRIPEFKAEGSGGESLSAEARASMTELITTYYDSFVTAVARNRGINAGTVLTDFGQGRVLDAQSALDVGMVDRIAPFSTVISEVVAAHSSSGSLFSLEGISMDPKIFGLLVRLGMCDITASQVEADAALARFNASCDTQPADDAEQIESLNSALRQRMVAVTPTHPVAAAATVPAATVQAPVVDSNSDRATQIMAAVRLAGSLDGEARMTLAQQLIANPTIDLAAAISQIEAADIAAQPAIGSSTIQPAAAERDKFVAEAQGAILQRGFGGNMPNQVWNFRAGEYQDFEGTRRPNYRLQGLPQLAEACLVQAGYSYADVSRLATPDIAKLAMGLVSPDSLGIRAAADGPAYNVSGMFSNILLDASNVMLRRSYDDSRTTFQTWCRQGESLRDFKLTHKVIAGELGDPRAIPEDGEFEEATHSDAKEAYRLVVWGQIFSITWQAVVNDQLSAFSEVPLKQGRAMKRKQNRLAYALLKDNAAMADTGTLFNATAVTTAGGHANHTTTGTVVSTAALNIGTTQMMSQKGLNTAADGSAILNIMPRYLLHPPAIRGTVMEILASTANPSAGGSAAGSSGVANIWQNGLEPVTEGELGATGAGGSDTAWYLAADNAEIDTVEYAFLQGLESPVLEQETAFQSLAIRQRIYQAFAVHPIDFRGLYKNDGA
jgi:signal peptide peptidase SppA